MITAVSKVSAAVDEDLEGYVTAVDDLLQDLRTFARHGEALTVGEIVELLLPRPGNRVTKRYCGLLAAALAIMLQRTVLGG